MKIEDAIALDHAGTTRGGSYGFHVVVVDETEVAKNSEEVDRYANVCLVRWWPESAESSETSDDSAEARAWERQFEIDRERDGSFHIAWRQGDDYPPAELTATLYDYVSEKLAGPRE